MSALELRSVSVALDGVRAIDGVSALIEEGEWVALIGPNGAGKTTLLRAVCRLVGHEGLIAVGGVPVTAFGRRELARRVALVPQVPVMPGELRVADYVLLGRTPHAGYFAGERARDREVARRALARLDLLGLADRRLGSLSGGERQRAVLARALAQEAPLLLLDEPTSSLDIGRGQQALELIDSLRREEGLTVLSAMHDLTLAGRYADRLLLLDRGRIVADGTAPEVLRPELIAAHYGAEVTAIELGDSGIAIVPARRPQAEAPRRRSDEAGAPAPVSSGGWPSPRS